MPGGRTKREIEKAVFFKSQKKIIHEFIKEKLHSANFLPLYPTLCTDSQPMAMSDSDGHMGVSEDT